MEQLRMIHKMKNLPEYTLAEGFTLRAYQPEDQAVWLEICSHGLLTEQEIPDGWKICVTDFPTLVPERDIYMICDKLDLHGIEMLDDDGNPTGIIL